MSWLGKEGGPEGARVLQVGAVALNLDTHRVSVDGEESVLTPKQFGLLGLFMSRPGEVLTRKQIMKEVWETDYTGDTRTLDVHIHWLRRLLGDSRSQPRYLHTVRGVGYRFQDPESAPDPDAGTQQR